MQENDDSSCASAASHRKKCAHAHHAATKEVHGTVVCCSDCPLLEPAIWLLASQGPEVFMAVDSGHASACSVDHRFAFLWRTRLAVHHISRLDRCFLSRSVCRWKSQPFAKPLGQAVSFDTTFITIIRIARFSTSKRHSNCYPTRLKKTPRPISSTRGRADAAPDHTRQRKRG